MNTVGLWQIGETGPQRLQVGALEAERDLETWIAGDPALLERGLVIVGRQLRLEAGPLDLLALDPSGRWVLIEIKKDRLRREVVAQAIDYASCLDRLDPGVLRKQCDDYLRSTGANTTLDALLLQRGRSLDAEADGRDVVVYLVGASVDAALERMVAYLAVRLEMSVRVVTFSVFRDARGGLLLAREIHEGAEQDRTTAPRVAPVGTASLDGVLKLADANGVGDTVRALCHAADELALPVRIWPKSIMVAPPANRTRCLWTVWVDPLPGQPAKAKVWFSAESFAQFYGITEEDLRAAVGSAGEFATVDVAGAERAAAGILRLIGRTAG